ncbi:neurexin [Plakobranchus ocellatus]|uniref:Neurexin n=1 Tax=Plakobranchus ocellatus TaxID=259542 RepID=A0AAV4CV71_9GAST|nr:neurexin [Plakobranchus ocellatus]
MVPLSRRIWPASFCLAVLEFLLMAAILPSKVLALNLDGSLGSYAQYPPWDMCLNGSISLDFKTKAQKALLLYLHRPDKLYFELKLMNGHLKLRANLGLGSFKIDTAQVVSDGEWHSVEVNQDGDVTTLIIDSVKYMEPSPGLVNLVQQSSLRQISGQALPASLSSSSLSSASSSSSSENESYVFIGGFPREYDSKNVSSLAVPLVIFEPRFRGSIRNFFYQNCSEEPQRPELLSSSGILTKDVDLCVRRNPCLNGGRCLTTDAGRVCDCSSTEYTGDRCDLRE